MLQAMAQGVAVVATRWSGNMEFTNDNNSILIRRRWSPLWMTPCIYHTETMYGPNLMNRPRPML